LPLASSSVVLAILVAGTGIGAAIDLATRRIPNGVVVTTALVGLAAAAGGASNISVGASLLGFGLGIGMMLPGHLFGGTGAGDVKLFGAVGAVVGVEGVLWAFCYTAIAGGVVAILWAFYQGRLTLTLRRVVDTLCRPRQTRATIVSTGAANTFPYGPAIAIGSVLSVVIRGDRCDGGVMNGGWRWSKPRWSCPSCY
jgi:prepilin peptidase CpaA